jgi:LPS sulfotransferase NodH
LTDHKESGVDKMTTKMIFVLCEARTGSTLLCQLLAHYKNVINFHEIFHNVDGGVNNDVFKTSYSFNKVLEDHYSVLNRQKLYSEIAKDPKQLMTLMRDHFKETLVVKIHLSQLLSYTYPIGRILDFVLTRPNNEFILLKRNFLESYISLLKAQKSDIWFNIDTANTKIAINPNRFNHELEKYEREYDNIEKKLQEHNIDYLNIDYDKDLKNYNITEFEQLVEHWSTRRGINLTSTEGSPYIKVKKQNTNDDISDSISNWEEVKTMIGKH